jgi:hypothetical protein
MLKLEILIHWIVSQQGKNHSEIDEEPNNGVRKFSDMPLQI